MGIESAEKKQGTREWTVLIMKHKNVWTYAKMIAIKFKLQVIRNNTQGLLDTKISQFCDCWYCLALWPWEMINVTTSYFRISSVR